jgi:hypothetical protein
VRRGARLGAATGGVSGPVPAGAAGGADGGAGRDAQHAREHGGWDLLGELVQRRQAHALRLNAKLEHSVSQRDGSEGSAGALAGEQPGRGQLFNDAASASQGQGLDEGGEGLGEFEPRSGRCPPHDVSRCEADLTCTTLLVDLEVHTPVIMRIRRHVDVSITLEMYANAHADGDVRGATQAGGPLRCAGQSSPSLLVRKLLVRTHCGLRSFYGCSAGYGGGVVRCLTCANLSWVSSGSNPRPADSLYLIHHPHGPGSGQLRKI